jgi:hypothetical protein
VGGSLVHFTPMEVAATPWAFILVAIITSTIAPSIVVAVRSRYDRKKEERDNKRQDDVALKAAAVAEAVHQVAIQTREAARLLVESNADVASTARSTNEKLDVIHVLVNSKVTVLVEQAHTASVLALAAMIDLVDLKKKHGEEPSVADLAEISSTRRRIAELSLTMLDRTEAAASTQAGRVPE